MKIGRKIYYELETGNIVLDTGQRIGGVETTLEQDFSMYIVLKNRVREALGVIQLEFGQYEQDFEECNGYRVNPATKELEFSYPDPNEPEELQPYQAPLSAQVASNLDYLLDVDFRLMMIELGLN